MHSPRPHRGRAPILGALLAFGIVVLLLNVAPPAKASGLSASSGPQPAAGARWWVTWNGVDVTSASTASSAMGIDFTQSANVLFNWNTGSSSPVTINDARLQMFYFGFAMTTRDQNVNNAMPQSNGSIPLSWTPLSLAYVLEGVYKITASFIAPNGTLFSENFYVRANALFGVVAAIPIVLLIIAIYEIYALVRSGRYAALDRKSTAPPPSGPPPTKPTTPPVESPAPTEPPQASSPPSGGSS